MAIGGGVVGDILYQQLAPMGDEVHGAVIPGCGHFVQEEQPDLLVVELLKFLA